MEREEFSGQDTETRGYSDAVTTAGGKIVWIAGVGRYKDEAGNALAGNFEEQVRASFRFIGGVLEKAGGKLEDIVTMTTFFTDPRLSDRYVAVRREFFPENCPSSALITVKGFDHPSMMLEIKAIAVIGG